jgi:predicted Zn-dependent protease
MFREGDPTAESLTPRRREELLLQLLESIEPREAEVILGIFQKDLGVKGLDYKFVKEAFPNLLP